MKSWIRHAASLLASLTLAGAAMAQGFPNKPVTLMVPYPPGGLSDVIARTIHTTLSKHLGQPVIVENLGGASGGIAAQKVLSSPADGYYIFQGSPNELILAPLTNAAIKYKSEDFRLVQMISINPMAMFARKDLPANNGDELLAYARKGAAEGKPLTYASVGPGSLYHLLGEHLSNVSGVPMTHVPYKGGAPAQQDLLKKVPPLNDSKAFKGVVFDTWSGYFVHKDTPEPVVQALHKALSEVLNDTAIRNALEAQAMVVPRPQPLSAMSKVYGDNTARYRAIAKAINLQPQ